MKQYKIQNRSQKNSQSCVPLNKKFMLPLRVELVEYFNRKPELGKKQIFKQNGSAQLLLRLVKFRDIFYTFSH